LRRARAHSRGALALGGTRARTALTPWEVFYPLAAIADVLLGVAQLFLIDVTAIRPPSNRQQLLLQRDRLLHRWLPGGTAVVGRVVLIDAERRDLDRQL